MNMKRNLMQKKIVIHCVCFGLRREKRKKRMYNEPNKTKISFLLYFHSTEQMAWLLLCYVPETWASVYTSWRQESTVKTRTKNAHLLNEVKIRPFFYFNKIRNLEEKSICGSVFTLFERFYCCFVLTPVASSVQKLVSMLLQLIC